MAGFVGATLGLYWMPKGYFNAEGNQREIAASLLNLGKWLLVATFLDTFYRRMDIFLLGYFTATKDVGIYSAALNIIFALDLLLLSIFTVMMPQVSKISSTSEFKEYIFHSLKLSLVIAIPLSVFYLFADQILVFFYSNRFYEAGKIFRILFINILSFHSRKRFCTNHRVINLAQRFINLAWDNFKRKTQAFQEPATLWA